MRTQSSRPPEDTSSEALSQRLDAAFYAKPADAETVTACEVKCGRSKRKLPVVRTPLVAKRKVQPAAHKSSPHLLQGPRVVLHGDEAFVEWAFLPKTTAKHAEAV